jgi:hypothetical protein
MKPTRTKLILAFGLLLTLSLASSCFFVSWMFPKRTSVLTPGQDGVDHYTNTVFGYSLPVPHGWTLSENMTPAPSFVVFSAPEADDQACIIISTLGEPLDMDGRVAFLKRQRADLIDMSTRAMTFEGISAHRLEYRWSGEILYDIFRFNTGKATFKTVSLHILREKDPITVRCVSDASRFDEHHGKFFRLALDGVELSVRDQKATGGDR